MSYVVCSQRHWHWGERGAAGLFIVYPDPAGPRVLLVRRSGMVMEPGTWGIPGGAIEAGEYPLGAAGREAREELGGLPDLSYAGTLADDHGNWAYHTIIAGPPAPFSVRTNWEADGAGWFSPGELGSLQLHPALAARLPEIWKAVRDHSGVPGPAR